MTTTVYLARHATPDWTRTDLVYHLPPGPPLTQKGTAEAGMLGQYFQKAGISRVYTSPLERCLSTAAIAAQPAGIPFEIVHSLTEWQPGEDYQAVINRVWPAFERARQTCRQNGPVALVTHGGPITALLEKLGMQPTLLLEHRIYDHGNPLPPAGAWQATQPDGREEWQLELVFSPEMDG